MNEPMIVIHKTSTRQINYKNILSFNVYKEVTMFHADQKADLVIVDVDSMQEAIVVCNRYRVQNLYLPMIVIYDSMYLEDIHEDLLKISGCGRVEMVYYYQEESNSITRAVESVLNPSLPQKREELAVAIPVFNEIKRLGYVKDFILKLQKLVQNGMYSLSVYLIDDGSSDDTVKELQSFIYSQKNNDDTIYYKEPLSIYPLKVNTRKAGTYMAAFNRIDADVIVTVDADDSFQIEDMIKMIHVIRQGYYDFVIGTKDSSKESRTMQRRMISFCKRTLTRPFLPKGVTDSQTGLKVFKKSTINKILPFMHVSNGLALDLEMLYIAKKLNYRVKEIPVTIIDREGSHVDLFKDTIRFLQTMLRLMRTQDYRKLVN